MSPENVCSKLCKGMKGVTMLALISYVRRTPQPKIAFCTEPVCAAHGRFLSCCYIAGEVTSLTYPTHIKLGIFLHSGLSKEESFTWIWRTMSSFLSKKQTFIHQLSCCTSTRLTHGLFFSVPGVGVPAGDVGTECPLRLVLSWNAGRSWVANVFINTLSPG